MAIGAGAGLVAGLLLGGGGGGKANPEKILNKNGPQFPETFSMSTITVIAPVKGNWPMVLEFEMRERGTALLSITAEGIEPYFYMLDGNRTGRQQVIIPRLPARFGEKVRPATYRIRALSGGPGELSPIYFRIFGLGAGPRAVGSVGIDQLRFGPPSVRPKLRQKAEYGFHSRSDFDKVSAEFLRAGLMDGTVVAKLVDKDKIGKPVRRNTHTSRQWNPKKANPGQHMLQVRAWTGLKKAGDWVIAWSPQLVRIEE
jgi:hypothetical protein